MKKIKAHLSDVVKIQCPYCGTKSLSEIKGIWSKRENTKHKCSNCEKTFLVERP